MKYARGFVKKMYSILCNEKWFWKTIGIFFRYRFIEEESGFFTKKYQNNFKININIENYSIDYGENSSPQFNSPSLILEHEDIVVLDCVDRLLTKGYDRKNIVIIADSKCEGLPNIILLNQKGSPYAAFSCYRWGKNYENALSNFRKDPEKIFKNYAKNGTIKYLCLYSSYLDGGLAYNNYAFYDLADYDKRKALYHAGIFEKDVKLYGIMPTCLDDEKEKQINNKKNRLSKYSQIEDYLIRDGVIIGYHGNEPDITTPNSISEIGMGAFWNCRSLKNIKLNHGITRIGGDAFYKCINLEKINIPATVREIGNDPFAGCPTLSLENRSKHFLLEDGVLYNRKKTQILHYPIKKQLKHFKIPSTVRYVNKHTFYENKYLRSIEIPKSVVWIENNMFSGCRIEEVINKSPYFCIDNGVLYNKDKTQIFSVFNHNLKELFLPDNVKKIGKNSFFGCKNLEHLHISKNVAYIGHNPFVGCSNLKFSNKSLKYSIENGMLINKKNKQLIYCPNCCVDGTVKIPDYIQVIGRNSFSFCNNLKTLRIPNSVKIIERGAFGCCINLEEIEIPDSVKKIEKWVFSYCKNLKQINIPKSAELENNAVAERSIRINLF